MSSDERKGISAILELLEIEEITRATLKTIAATLDDPQTVKSWNLEKYHEKRLEDPGGGPNEPDFFFRQHGSSKSRVILRLAAKDILGRVRRLPSGPRTKLIGIFDSLPLHRQINDWVTRYDRRRWTQRVSLESQGESGNGDRRKRQHGLRHVPLHAQCVSLTLGRDWTRTKCHIETTKTNKTTIYNEIL